MRVADIGRDWGKLSPAQEADMQATEAEEREIRRTPFFRGKWGEWERFKRVLMFGFAGAVLMFGLIWFVSY